MIKKIICWFLSHKVNDGEFIDSHGEIDGLTYCERCGAYDA